MPLAAIEVPTLYTAEVPLDEEADDPRGEAYKAALVEVLLRVSGSELALDEEMVSLLFPNPGVFVTQFRPGEDESLWITLDGEAIRSRTWDSCFSLDFTELHGHAVRGSRKSRYRQWMTHKLATWQDQFGTIGCVGCGRCITWCPVGIDITEEVSAMREAVPV